MKYGAVAVDVIINDINEVEYKDKYVVNRLIGLAYDCIAILKILLEHRQTSPRKLKNLAPILFCAPSKISFKYRLE